MREAARCFGFHIGDGGEGSDRDEIGSGRLCEKRGDAPAIVARAHVPLLVSIIDRVDHDDSAERREGSEEGLSCADDDGSRIAGVFPGGEILLAGLCAREEAMVDTMAIERGGKELGPDDFRDDDDDRALGFLAGGDEDGDRRVAILGSDAERVPAGYRERGERSLECGRETRLGRRSRARFGRGELGNVGDEMRERLAERGEVQAADGLGERELLRSDAVRNDDRGDFFHPGGRPGRELLADRDDAAELLLAEGDADQRSGFDGLA